MGYQARPNCIYCNKYCDCSHPNKPKFLFFFKPVCDDMYETCILKKKHTKPAPPRIGQSISDVPSKPIRIELILKGE